GAGVGVPGRHVRSHARAERLGGGRDLRARSAIRRPLLARRTGADGMTMGTQQVKELSKAAPAPRVRGELPDEGRRRVVIEGVSPEIDAGRFPIKRAAGETVVVEADVFADGHDRLAAILRYRDVGTETAEGAWRETAMALVENDRWQAAFTV